MFIRARSQHNYFGTISGEVLPDSPSQKVMQDLSGTISPDIVIFSDLARSWILLFQDLARIFSWAHTHMHTHTHTTHTQKTQNTHTHTNTQHTQQGRRNRGAGGARTPPLLKRGVQPPHFQLHSPAAIDTIIKDYVLLMETLEEIHTTTRDEYGLKASGYLQSLEKFYTLFGLRLAHNVFGAAEQVSFALQKKNISIQDALCAVDAAKAYFKRIRSDPEFNRFYDATVKISENYGIRKPELPWYRQCPVHFDEGSFSHQFPDPWAYFRHTYYEVCDLLIKWRVGEPIF